MSHSIWTFPWHPNLSYPICPHLTFTRIFPAGHRAHTVYVGVHVPGGRRHSQRRRKHHHSGPGGGGTGATGGGGSIGGSGSVGGGAGKDNISEKQQEVERPGASRFPALFLLQILLRYLWGVKMK
ncbi:hypothetical protein M5D96_004202 [Drosophila gunungcola]|uniref:Uncharacterized protein n=1 Tax=Drosophila gunungcola TaxID=103775 RepID=A0A9P9YTH9_9MUSC|nr:hypothetical protein M5D96_004202 [Drosophila gunungcola]